MFTMVPGLKVVMPSTPYDAKGLLIQAIRDDDPVIFLEHKACMTSLGEVPDEAYRPLWRGRRRRARARDVTVVAFSLMAHAPPRRRICCEREGISVEVIDPRTTSPLDLDSILESVEKTGRLVVVDESPPRCSLAADIAAQVAEHGFAFLKAPIVTVTCPHTPSPFSPVLEDLYMPSVERIAAAIRGVAADDPACRRRAQMGPGHGGRHLGVLAGGGQRVCCGQEIAEIESSKIANALEAPAGGVLSRRVASPGRHKSGGCIAGGARGCE